MKFFHLVKLTHMLHTL